MKARWEVIYEQRSVYDGLIPQDQGGEYPHERARTSHRTFVGAEVHRRFRARTPNLGMRWVITLIVRPGTPWTPELEPAPRPRYAQALDKVVWPTLYFVRSRLDGLRMTIRHGYDRDKRENW